MEKKVLSGIERELVLQYLIDGNVPVTVTPLEENGIFKAESEKIRPLSSVVFPVAIKSEQISVLKEGIILLMNVPKNVEAFLGKKVKVEFYFNSVGLFFVSEMKKASSGPALVVPKEISRIEDVPVEQKYDFSAKFYTSENEEDSFLSCLPAEGFQFFVRPAWNSIPLERQEKAKSYLERFVLEAKKSGRAGNGIQLVNVCRYLVDEGKKAVVAKKDRLNLDIVFLNHERLVLGLLKNDSVSICAGDEYWIKISFVLRASVAMTRDIRVRIKADSVYEDENGKKICADCTYIDLKEEDVRFLYEKATSLLFI